ncbi:multiple sugar transport system substrate-binding protein [Kribbella sp. VKM Ac-2571]|uniref:substrate-binding domain-containing protein n=1 Tax=Kribbella sp. VKM Ac-2571 TaxID=2512222 RepID=UPI0010DBA8E2|nr:substrate-binding domain-containing protein [Kribbella sp. VKM Ac-2571]TDO69071.1 multiple sugar transport system substrate-binding protein [Kribbella sp. VKM Ac-2571]
MGRQDQNGWRPTPSMSRRSLLKGAVAAAGGLTVAGCSTLSAGLAGSDVAPGTVDYWNLFGGGDGVRMQQMLDQFQQTHPALGLQAVTLQWGNPYYTKLALATVGDKPPDVAVSHLSRVPTLVSAGLVQSLEPSDLEAHGMTPDKFSQSAWEGCQVDGKTYAIPLDTHPFVLFYNTDICKKAGLLGADDQLVSLNSPDRLVDALTKAKQVSGAWGGVTAVNGDTATNWRMFQSWYAQLGGEVLKNDGTEVVLDDDKALRVLEYLKRLSVDTKLMPSSVDYQGAVALFASGKAGFYMQGEWEITTFQTAKTPFSMTLFPNVFGGDRYAVQADRHTLIVPNHGGREPRRTDRALILVRSLLDQSLTWAKGGHVPAWLPVKDGTEYKALRPQSNYASAADAAVLDPPAWYSGSGSNFEIVVGSAVATVRSGQAAPDAALKKLRQDLQVLADTPPPT